LARKDGFSYGFRQFSYGFHPEKKQRVSTSVVTLHTTPQSGSVLAM
jgi:hypothetical protein